MDYIGYEGKIVMTKTINGHKKTKVFHNTGTVSLFEMVARHLTKEDSINDQIYDIQLFTQSEGVPVQSCLYRPLQIGKTYFESDGNVATVFVDSSIAYSNIIQELVKAVPEEDALLFLLRSRDGKVLAKANASPLDIKSVGIGRQAQISWQLSFKNVE